MIAPIGAVSSILVFLFLIFTELYAIIQITCSPALIGPVGREFVCVPVTCPNQKDPLFGRFQFKGTCTGSVGPHQGSRRAGDLFPGVHQPSANSHGNAGNQEEKKGSGGESYDFLPHPINFLFSDWSRAVGDESPYHGSRHQVHSHRLKNFFSVVKKKTISSCFPWYSLLFPTIIVI